MGLKDTFYISHGSPTLAIDDSLAARQFLKSWQREVFFEERPKAILVISGHWDTKYPSVNVVRTNETIYDFYNFPDAMYQLKYTAPGAPELAKRVKELLKGAGFDRIDEDESRGLDHGAWVLLMLMYPEADIPVCQLSVQSHQDGTHHYNMGKALAPLKDDGVLVMGSGSAVHNLRALEFRSTSVPSWAAEFDAWLTDALLQGRYEDVNHYEAKAPHAKMAHPWPDHFYPLHVAIGAAGENANAKQIHTSWQLGTLSYSSWPNLHEKDPLKLYNITNCNQVYVMLQSYSWTGEFKPATTETCFLKPNFFEEGATRITRDLLPLHVAMGAAGDNANAIKIHQCWQEGN